jgi:hypothetical protein
MPAGSIFRVCLVLLIVAPLAHAQSIVLDQPIRAGELTFFAAPGADDEYYYATDKARLAVHPSGKPQFSLLRYVENVRSGAADDDLREGTGGGILHAVVELAVTPDQLEEARRELRRLRPDADIVGPAMFRSGKFALISSFADESGELTERVVGVGTAPILEGGKAAVSIQLSKLGAKVIWESFHSETPDVSFSFEMELSGYHSPVRATLDANFEKIYSHEAFDSALALQTPKAFLATEISQAFDELRQSGAITVTQIGEDANLEQLLETAYRKLIDAMFEPAHASTVSAASGGDGLLEKATSTLSSLRSEARKANETIRAENQERARLNAQRREQIGKLLGVLPEVQIDENVKKLLVAQDQQPDVNPEEASSVEGELEQIEEEELPQLAAFATYELKRSRQTVDLHIDFNKYTPDTRTIRFDENIGSLVRYLDDDEVFRSVNLDDPLFKQREIVVFVDGFNASDFAKYINFVNVQMRKKHQGGAETLDEVRIDRARFSEDANRYKLLYGWKDDADRSRWLEYEYRTQWSFFGGAEVDSDWQAGNFSSLALTPPYQPRSVALEADPEVIREAGVRAIQVRIFYDLAGKPQQAEASLSPGRGELASRIEFALPGNETEYEYEIEWLVRGVGSVKSGRQRTGSSVLFVDELPQIGTREVSFADVADLDDSRIDTYSGMLYSLAEKHLDQTGDGLGRFAQRLKGASSSETKPDLVGASLKFMYGRATKAATASVRGRIEGAIVQGIEANESIRKPLEATGLVKMQQTAGVEDGKVAVQTGMVATQLASDFIPGLSIFGDYLGALESEMARARVAQADFALTNFFIEQSQDVSKKKSKLGTKEGFQLDARREYLELIDQEGKEAGDAHRAQILAALEALSEKEREEPPLEPYEYDVIFYESWINAHWPGGWRVRQYRVKNAKGEYTGELDDYTIPSIEGRRGWIDRNATDLPDCAGCILLEYEHKGNGRYELARASTPGVPPKGKGGSQLIDGLRDAVEGRKAATRRSDWSLLDFRVMKRLCFEEGPLARDRLVASDSKKRNCVFVDHRLSPDGRSLVGHEILDPGTQP